MRPRKAGADAVAPTRFRLAGSDGARHPAGVSPRTYLAASLGLPFLLNLPAHAAAPATEPAVEATQLPRIPPTPPDQALSTFRVKPGFRLELVAAEPGVIDPIALSFDEDARLYVVEMRDYSERRPERLGRIRRL